jgi:hypothetical protein
VNAALIFTPDGQGRCVHTEAIDLRTIGRLTVKRATTLVFDNARQYWHVKDRRGFRLYASPSRQVCLDWERQYLETQEEIKHGGVNKTAQPAHQP